MDHVQRPRITTSCSTTWRDTLDDISYLGARTRREPALVTDTSVDRSIVDVQQYWDARPCNIRHSPEPVGSREYFDEVEARKYFVEPHIPAFAEFERWRGKRVLEVGCGIGTDSINFARAGADLTAVDLSSESLRIAAQRADVMGVADRIRVRPGERRRADVGARRRALRPRLLVRRRPPHAASRARAGRDARARRAGRHAQADDLPPSLVEGLLDRRGARTRPLLEDARARDGALRSPDRLSGDIHATRAVEARELVERSGFRVTGTSSRSCLSVPGPRLRGVPIRQAALFPLDAGAALPRVRASARLAHAAHSGSRLAARCTSRSSDSESSAHRSLPCLRARVTRFWESTSIRKPSDF